MVELNKSKIIQKVLDFEKEQNTEGLLQIMWEISDYIKENTDYYVIFSEILKILERLNETDSGTEVMKLLEASKVKLSEKILTFLINTEDVEVLESLADYINKIIQPITDHFKEADYEIHEEVSFTHEKLKKPFIYTYLTLFLGFYVESRIGDSSIHDLMDSSRELLANSGREIQKSIDFYLDKLIEENTYTDSKTENLLEKIRIGLYFFGGEHVIENLIVSLIRRLDDKSSLIRNQTIELLFKIRSKVDLLTPFWTALKNKDSNIRFKTAVFLKELVKEYRDYYTSYEYLDIMKILYNMLDDEESKTLNLIAITLDRLLDNFRYIPSEIEFAHNEANIDLNEYKQRILSINIKDAELCRKLVEALYGYKSKYLIKVLIELAKIKDRKFQNVISNLIKKTNDSEEELHKLISEKYKVYQRRLSDISLYESFTSTVNKIFRESDKYERYQRLVGETYGRFFKKSDEKNPENFIFYLLFVSHQKLVFL